MTTVRTTVLAAALSAVFFAGPAFAAETTLLDACGIAPQAPAMTRPLSHDEVSAATRALHQYGVAADRYNACARTALRTADPADKAPIAAAMSRLSYARQDAGLRLTVAVREFRDSEGKSLLSQVAEKN